MGMVVPERRIGSAFFVYCGRHGEVSAFAQQQGVSRQWVYREAKQVSDALAGTQARVERERLRQENEALRATVAQLQQLLAKAVVLDKEKQAEFAGVGQGCGVTLTQCDVLLNVLIPGESLNRASLGRRTQALGKKAGALLAVLDEYARAKVREAAADEIYVRDPVLMVVEQESLCWVSGKLTDEVSGAAWSKEFGLLPHLEQVARDGGSGLAKGVALQNEQRQKQDQEAGQEPRPPKPPAVPLWEQGDHFHALWTGGVGLRRAPKRAGKALALAEAAQHKLEECARQGKKQTGPAIRACRAWRKAEQAMDDWSQLEKTWQQTKEALLLITPEGELNTRAQAEAKLAQTLPQLPDDDFAKTKRQLQQPEMLNYLDRVQEQLRQLPFAEEVKHAAVRQEALRRRPELLQGENSKAAALRGVMLVYAVVLGQAGETGQQAVTAVRDIFRRAYRASSLVECINSVLRMQQAQHRKMTQGLLDLKRLYWNCHTFRTGRRRGTTPYERLGVPWPPGMRWWDLLKLTPEQLREQLSTATKIP
jgi:predicted NBD/HSP70 family sugar kinase